MKVINDERLKIKNLKHIKVAFILETLGVMVILLWNFINNGARAVFDSPLFFLLILVSTVLCYMSLDISVEYDKIKSPKKSLIIHTIVSLIVSIGFGFIATLLGSNYAEGIILGIVFFICFFISSIYLYKLRSSKLKEFDQED